MSRTKLPLWLLKDPDQARLLRLTAADVDLLEISKPTFQQLIDDMVVTMYQANGIGLAAPQIGQSLRLAVIAPEVDASLSEPLVIINPTITKPSSEQEVIEEGCLSIPKVFGPVHRALSLTVQALDRRGRPFRLNASGLLARVIQHEVDHLLGRLFIDRADHISSGKKFLP